jgi:translation initiation factor eIF-2B subunit epsilon
MGRKGGGGGDDDPSDSKHEQKLQAVLLADSFSSTFRPITLDKTQPKVLCPLNNVTMLDYSIEFLAGAGVEELFVFCVGGAETVEEYVKDNANTRTSSIKVTCVRDPHCTNAGDALRELDKRNLVQSDPFILMSGDVVTNVDIVPALAAHKARKKKDNYAMMTVLLKQVGGWDVAPTEGGKERARASPLRHSADDLVVGLDPDNENRILLFDSDPGRASLPLPTSFFVSHRKIDVRTDMLDTGIDICSPDVLARFSDEFDYRDIRKQFVHNSVAEEEEGLQNRIHAHILGPSEYAARVHDPRTYAAVSSDLLRRWCYPVVPDNLPSAYEKRYRYVLQRHHLYREAKGGRSRIGRSSSVIGPGMVGSRCHIGEGCNIKVSCFFAKCVPLNGARCVNMHSSLEAIPHLLPLTLSYIICTLTNNDIIAHRHWQPLRH